MSTPTAHWDKNTTNSGMIEPKIFSQGGMIPCYLFNINAVQEYSSYEDFKTKFRQLNPDKLQIHYHEYSFIDVYFSKRSNRITISYRCSCSLCQARLNFHIIPVNGNWFIKGPVQHSQHKPNCYGITAINVFPSMQAVQTQSAIVVNSLMLNGCTGYNDVIKECNTLFPELPKESADLVATQAFRKIISANPMRVDPLVRFEKLFTFEGIDYLFNYNKEPSIIIFAHPVLLSGLSQAEYISIDGTFKCVIHIKPFAGYQLVTILYLDPVTLVYLPAAHAILPGKEQNQYDAFINIIRSKLPKDLKLVTCDFEQAIKNCLINAGIPEDRISGCLFHYRQSIYRKYREIKNPTQKSYSIYVVVMVLPFFSQRDFLETLEELEKVVDAETSSFLTYVVSQWAANYQWIQKYSRLIEIYSNNASEAMHSQLGKAVDQKKIQSLYDLAKVLFGIDKSRLQERETLMLHYKKKKRSHSITDHFRETYENATSVLGIHTRDFYVDPSSSFFKSSSTEMEDHDKLLDYFTLYSEDTLDQSFFLKPDPNEEAIAINPFFLIKPNDRDLIALDVMDQINKQ